ncbi:MAG: hypothetical protein ACRD3Q_11765 [Terriglobales bacterium]
MDAFPVIPKGCEEGVYWYLDRDAGSVRGLEATTTKTIKIRTCRVCFSGREHAPDHDQHSDRRGDVQQERPERPQQFDPDASRFARILASSPTGEERLDVEHWQCREFSADPSSPRAASVNESAGGDGTCAGEN